MQRPLHQATWLDDTGEMSDSVRAGDVVDGTSAPAGIEVIADLVVSQLHPEDAALVASILPADELQQEDAALVASILPADDGARTDPLVRIRGAGQQPQVEVVHHRIGGNDRVRAEVSSLRAETQTKRVGAGNDAVPHVLIAKDAVREILSILPAEDSGSEDVERIRSLLPAVD